MVVKIRFYSVAKELAGVSEMPLDVSSGSTLGTALDALFSAQPNLAALRRSSLFAVGLDYAPPTTILKDGDEINFIPPVQGG